MADESNMQIPAALQAWLRSALAASLPAALAEAQSSLPDEPLSSPARVTAASLSSAEPEGSHKRIWADAPSTADRGKTPLKKARSVTLPSAQEPDVSPFNYLATEYEILEYRAGSSGLASPPIVAPGSDSTLEHPRPSATVQDQPLKVADDAGVPLFDPGALRHPRSAEWTPSTHIAEFLKFWLRRPLDKEVRQRLQSECPRPTIPAKVSNTPEFDQTFVTFLARNGKEPRKGIELGLQAAQDKLLDVSGPLTQIFQMADEALADGSPLDPNLVREWVQRAICLLGNANCAISTERRKAALFKMDAKLAELADKELGPDANGLLFGDRFFKDLNQHVDMFTSPRAGRQRGRAASRAASFGARPSFPDASTTYRAQYHYPFPRGANRGRGYTSFRGRSSAGRPSAT